MEIKNCIDELTESTKTSNNKKIPLTKALRGNSFEVTLKEALTGLANDDKNSNNNQFVEDSNINCNTLRNISIDERADSAVAKLANIFGISKELMNFILNNLGIKPADLLNPDMKKKIMSKLSGLLPHSKSKEKLSEALDSFYKNN